MAGPRPSRAAAIAIAAVVLAALIGLALGATVLAGDGATQTKFVDRGCKIGEGGCTARFPVHVHADFAVFIDGQQFSFDQDRFVSGTSEKDELSPIVHIHRPRSTVVHVHQSGTTWDEFLRTLGFALTDPTLLPGLAPDRVTLTLPDGRVLKPEGGKTFKFYLNGVRVDGIGRIDIGDLARVLISYGSETEDQVRDQQLPKVTDQACIPSEKCPERIPPDEPPEPCKGSGTCS